MKQLREKAELYKTRGTIGGRICDNTEREGRGDTELETSDGGGSTTIQRGKVEATQNKALQRGDDLRGYR